MNAKYAKKANPNPNEADLFGFANVIPAQLVLAKAGSGNPDFFAGSRKLAAGSCFTKTNPIFSRPNMRY